MVMGMAFKIIIQNQDLTHTSIFLQNHKKFRLPAGFFLFFFFGGGGGGGGGGSQ